MIAMALASPEPGLMIADEPTTALDVTIQAQILQLLRELKERVGMSLLLITHDMGVVAETADRVAVMYAGRKVEDAPVEELFANPRHPYTAGLLACQPSAPANRGARRLTSIEGSVPDLLTLGDGCPFANRCENASRNVLDLSPGVQIRRKSHILLSPSHRILRSNGMNSTGAPLLSVDNIFKNFRNQRRSGTRADPSGRGRCVAYHRTRGGGGSGR